jgi:filamentous hemagglutinin
MGYDARMEKILMRLMKRLLCLVIFTGAVACSGEKGASGQKVVEPEVQQVKTVVTDGKHRKKPSSSPQSTSERVVVENNSLSKLALEGCAIAAPCRAKVAEQLLEIGVKAGLTGIVAKTLADKLTADELDHLVTLQMTGNDEITSKYLGLLQDKYAPEASSNPNLGKDLDNDQKAELGGVGSGTPGGWGPEDEEKGRNQQTQSNNFDDKFKKEDLTSSANKPINHQGLSAAARAWEKHAGRPGGVFDPLKGNTAQKNEAASNFVNEVLNNKGTVRTDLSRGGVEYRLPDGRGVRYNSDGSFSGFLDPKR